MTLRGKEKKLKNEKEHEHIEMEIKNMFGLVEEDYFSSKRKERPFMLESQKVKILKQVEETWRQKSCTVWIQVGDNNRKKVIVMLTKEDWLMSFGIYRMKMILLTKIVL